jgi:glycosyltransferase involved in cell wall biosynthesis
LAPRKILHLTSAHPVRDPRIFHKQCVGLARLGYDVRLAAAHDRAETVDGVRIVPLDRPRGRRDRMTRVAWQALRAAARERPDVCQVHDPELLWVAALLALGGRRVVYDVHEDVPKQVLGKHWIPPRARPLVARAVAVAEQVVARLLDGIVAATPAIAEKFPAAKTVVVQNFPEASFALDGAGRAPPTDAFVYAGGLMEIQGVREMAQAFALLPEGMTGTVAGTFRPAGLERQVAQLPGWRRVRYLGQVGRPEVLRAIDGAAVGLVLNHPTPNYVEAYPTKMFEYMARGLPVVCSDFALWAGIVCDADCGIAVDPRDPHAIAEAIGRLNADPELARRLGENGRRAVRERMNWERELRKLDALYRTLA